MSTVAEILHSKRSEITFRVDAVETSKHRWETRSALAGLEAQTGRPLLSSSHDPEFLTVVDEGHHPLVSAVHLAFSQHHPLVLSPDAIWMTIAQGLAQHINNNAEQLRPLLVRHQGRMELIAEVEALSSQEHWEETISLWTKAIEHNISADMRGLMLCDFSTTTPTIRTASAVVMMDAFQRFFDYFVYCICGIPQITVQGTVDDWHAIRDRVERIAHLDLSWWTDRLLPICDGFIATAEGVPSQDFWREIYKPEGRYGGDVITGWIADLFPYLQNYLSKAPTIRNPILFKSRSELQIEDGIPASSFPNGLSQAPATLKMLHDQKERSLLLLGGMIGVTQNPVTGAIQPEIGWGVQERDGFDQTLNRLKREHLTFLPLEEEDGGQMSDEIRTILRAGMPAEMIQMWDQFDGAVLFSETSHPWHIRSRRDYTRHKIADTNEWVTCFADLKDRRSIGFTYMSFEDPTDADPRNRRVEWWIVVGPLEFRALKYHDQDVEMLTENTRMIGRGLPQFFERMLEAEGRYYFDDPEFVPDVTLIPEQ